MKEKYRELAKNLISILDLGKREPMHAHQCGAINEAADFLQSMADMPDDEPSDDAGLGENGRINGLQLVTKANRDWWKHQCAIRVIRIAELEADVLALKNNAEIDQRTIEELTEDQPKRPLLADQPEVFGKLMYMMSEAHRMNVADWNDNVIELREMLVGE